MARVLVVTWNYPPTVGGIENYVAAATAAIAGTHEVTVITRGIPGLARESGVVRLGGRGISGFLPRALAALPGLVRRTGADLLVAGSAAVSPVTAIAGRLTRRPAAAFTYGLDLVYPSFPYQRMIRSSLPRHRAIVAISGETGRLAEAAGVDPSRIRFIPPGVPAGLAGLIAAAPERAAGKASLDVAGRPLLLMAGRLTPRKGTLRFVEQIFPRILGEIPNAVLAIVGDDPAEALVRANRRGESAAIDATIDRMGLAGSVLRMSRVADEQLAALYRTADLFVLPAREIPGDVEGFGMVVVEAAFAGTPAIVTRCGGIPDTVDEGITGLVLPPDNAKAMADTIVALLRDPTRLAAMGAAAADRVRRQFTQEALAPRWLELVSELTSRGGSDASGPIRL